MENTSVLVYGQHLLYSPNDTATIFELISLVMDSCLVFFNFGQLMFMLLLVKGSRVLFTF